jgi:xylulokinase
MPDPLLLGIDVGTGGSKAILIDTAGTVLDAVTTPYPLSTPRPLWSEQDPEAWWSATVASIRGVMEKAGVGPDAIGGIGLTGQMHGLVLIDDSGAVLRPAILWNDQRTAAECDAIHERVGRDRMIAITGKPALPSFTAPKILWVREHEPTVYAAAATMLLPKDYVRFRLTGVRASDVADASGTSLFDVRRRTWSDEVVDALDVPRAWLPDVGESPEMTSAVSADGANATGLAAGTPVAAGAGDQAAEAVGCAIVEPGTVSVTLGTSGVVFAALPAIDPDAIGALHGYCHAVPGMAHVMGVMLSAGGSFQWYADTIGAPDAAGDPFETLLAEAADAPVGAEGLVFLPYLAGERTPHPDPLARGAFVGLTLRHGRGHLTRAVMEGVTFGLRDALDLVRAIGPPVTEVRVSGGGTRSPLWRQIMADVFDADVVTVNATQGAAFGAAVLAGAGIGALDGVAAGAASIVRETGRTRPGADVAAYGATYERYRALYPVLAPEFHALSATAGV